MKNLNRFLLVLLIALFSGCAATSRPHAKLDPKKRIPCPQKDC